MLTNWTERSVGSGEHSEQRTRNFAFHLRDARRECHEIEGGGERQEVLAPRSSFIQQPRAATQPCVAFRTNTRRLVLEATRDYSGRLESIPHSELSSPLRFSLIPLTTCLLHGHVKIGAAHTCWTDLVSRQRPLLSLHALIYSRWMVDAIGSKKSGLGVKHFIPRYMHIDDAVLLIECLMQGAVESDDPRYDTSILERFNAQVFIYSYVKPSYLLATRKLCITFRIQDMQVSGRRLPQINILHLQYHLVYLRHLPNLWRRHGFAALSHDRPRLILERHSAKIRRLSHSRTPEGDSAGQESKESSEYELSEERFEEFRLSISLYLYGTGGEFRLVVTGDSGAEVNLNPSLPFEKRHARSSLRLDPNSLGHLAGLTHFLVNLVHLVDTWHAGWKDMLNKIDDIVGFEVTIIHKPSPFQVLSKANIV